LKKHHPNSFGHKRYETTEEYQELISKNYYYHDALSPTLEISLEDLKLDEIERNWELFVNRPPKTELPKFLNQAGTVDVKFKLDFGSFRDLQRHRAIIQRMPLLTMNLGFNSWYVRNIPEETREKLYEHLEEIKRKINAFGISHEDTQYFTPMGYNTSNRFTGDLPAVIYMVELRDSRFVHPTLQKVAHDIGLKIKDKLGIPIHVDSEPSRFDIKRGEHDIIVKK